MKVIQLNVNCSESVNTGNFESVKWNYGVTIELEEGDCLLMSIRGKGLNHIGVYAGEQELLHHLQGRLSSRDLLDEWLIKCIGRRITLRNA